MKTPINLIKGDKIGDETDYRDFLPVNMTAVLKPILGAKGYMLQYDGLTLLGTATGVSRGGVWNERFLKHYRVSGTDFIEVDETGIVTVLGTVAGSSSNVSLPYSFNTQAIIAEGNYYLYDPVGGFRQIIDIDLGTPVDAVWVNGVYFFTDGDYLYHTDASDESMISPLQFATAEFMPDNTLGVGKTQDNKVIAFGRYSTEYFADQATDDFRFRRIESRAIKIGIVGTHCKIEIADNWYILGGRKQENLGIHVLGVGSAVKISTREIEKILESYDESELTNASLETYKKSEYSFLKVNLPNHTLLFNLLIAEAVGIEFAWSIINTEGELSYRGIHCVNDPRIGKWILGDKYNSNLGILSEAVTTQYDSLVYWLLTTPFLNLEGQSIDEFAVDTIPGHTGSDDAVVFISLTCNGVTYGTEFIQLYGEPYNYNLRFIIRRLGVVNEWVGFKLRGASLAKIAFGKAVLTHG